jgi:hypothetical protein
MAYTTIDDPSAYFQSILWTGNDTDGRALTNDGNSDLQPDLVWLKNRDAGYNHIWTDSTRGVTKNLYSNLTNAEATVSNKVESFDTNGFTVGYDGSQVPNKSPRTFVAWQWKANGGTTSFNTDGTITTAIQTNSDAGFSICRHDGNGTAGATFGHGLGVKPSFIISKRTDSITNWRCYHSSLGATKHILLNTTGAAVTATDTWNNTEPTSSVVTVGNSSRTNASGSPILFYVFAEKQGYSKFGKFTANGNSNGAFVYTGFKPAFLMWKISSGTGNWSILNTDNKNYNVADAYLSANLTNAETTATPVVDLLSNGFKDRFGLLNGSTYIYMAFAENPFVTSTGIPTTAR